MGPSAALRGTQRQSHLVHARRAQLVLPRVRKRALMQLFFGAAVLASQLLHLRDLTRASSISGYSESHQSYQREPSEPSEPSERAIRESHQSHQREPSRLITAHPARSHLLDELERLRSKLRSRLEDGTRAQEHLGLDEIVHVEWVRVLEKHLALV